MYTFRPAMMGSEEIVVLISDHTVDTDADIIIIGGADRLDLAIDTAVDMETMGSFCRGNFY
jgi:hypothetical protein